MRFFKFSEFKYNFETQPILCYYRGMKTEYQKMLDGEVYEPWDKDLKTIRDNAHKLVRMFNQSQDNAVLKELFQREPENLYIEAPFYCDYGRNIELGKNIYMNFNCTILDCAKVKIGDNTLLGPNCQIYTPCHPTDAKTRIELTEWAEPVTIGKNCWLGGNVTVLPGVNIGNNSVIGAGSVVTKNIPANSIAAGNPCKVIRILESQDYEI